MIAFALSLLVQDPVTVSQSSESTQVYVGQAVVVTVDVEASVEYLESSMIPLFRRALDLPVQLELPWLAANDGRVLRAPVGAEDGQTMAISGKVLRVPTAVKDDRIHASLEWALIFDEPGALTLDGARLNYAYTSRFEQDLLGSRRPVDRNDVALAAAPIDLEVLRLPLESQPSGFGGAVGRFELATSLDRNTITIGEPFFLELRIRGDGDLDAFAAPDLSRLDGFELLGQLEQRPADARLVVYELVPTSTVGDTFPPIRLDAFNPVGARYESIRSESVALEVLGRPAASPVTAPPPLLSFKEGDGVAPSPRGWLYGLAALPAVLWVFLAGARLLRSHRSQPRVRMRRAARRLLRALPPAHESEQRVIYERFLADLLGSESGALLASPDLKVRLQATGIAPATAASVVAVGHSILSREYGGEPAPSLIAQVTALEAALRRPEASP